MAAVPDTTSPGGVVAHGMAAAASGPDALQAFLTCYGFEPAAHTRAFAQAVLAMHTPAPSASATHLPKGAIAQALLAIDPAAPHEGALNSIRAKLIFETFADGEATLSLAQLEEMQKFALAGLGGEVADTWPIVIEPTVSRTSFMSWAGLGWLPGLEQLCRLTESSSGSAARMPPIIARSSTAPSLETRGGVQLRAPLAARAKSFRVPRPRTLLTSLINPTPRPAIGYVEVEWSALEHARHQSAAPSADTGAAASAVPRPAEGGTPLPLRVPLITGTELLAWAVDLTHTPSDEELGRVQSIADDPYLAPLIGFARNGEAAGKAAEGKATGCLLFAWPEGGMLSQPAGGPLPWTAKLTIVHSAALGLAALHTAGETHGAVCCEAIGVRGDGSAWLMWHPDASFIPLRDPSGFATSATLMQRMAADVGAFGQLLHLLLDTPSDVTRTISVVDKRQTELTPAQESWPPELAVVLSEVATECEFAAADHSRLSVYATQYVAARLAYVLQESAGTYGTAVNRDGAEGVHGSSAEAVHGSSDTPMALEPPAPHELPEQTSKWSQLRMAICACHALKESTLAPCVVCLELVPKSTSLVCPDHSAASSHVLCADCLAGTIGSLRGTVELRDREGGLCCYASDGVHGPHPRETTFKRAQVEPLLGGETLKLYLEMLEPPPPPPEDISVDGSDLAMGDVVGKLELALCILCPTCHEPIDPSPDGCIAMPTGAQNGGCPRGCPAFCWLCMAVCGKDAHPHVNKFHSNVGFFPAQPVLKIYQRWQCWLRVRDVLSAAFPNGGRARDTALERIRGTQYAGLEEYGLWPFPDAEPVPDIDIAVELSYFEQFIIAARDGDVAGIEAALADHPEFINATDRDRQGMTALMLAAHAGQTEAVVLLISRGADVMLRDNGGWTALHYAVERRRVETVRLLLAAWPPAAPLRSAGIQLPVDAALFLLDVAKQQRFHGTLWLCGLTASPVHAAENDLSGKQLQFGDVILLVDELLMRAGCTPFAFGLESLRGGGDENDMAEWAREVSKCLDAVTDLSADSVADVNLLFNGFDLAACSVLHNVSKKLRVSLCGFLPGQTEADLEKRGFLSSADVVFIAEALKLRPSMTSLSLKSNPSVLSFSSIGAFALAEALPESSLTTLNLLGCGLDDMNAAKLIDCAAKMPALRSLCGLTPEQTEADFSNAGLSSAEATLLAAEIARHPSLTSVCFLGNGFGTEVAATLLSMKRACPRLLTLCGLAPPATELDISLRGGEAMLLAPELGKLRRASLSRIDDASGRQLAAALAEDHGSLTELSLLKNPFGVETAALLAEVSRQIRVPFCSIPPEQEEASFYCKGLRAADAILVAAALFFRPLTSLDISDNYIGPEGGKALAKALSSCSLTCMDLAANDIGVEGGKAIGSALPESALTVLNLSRNALGNDGGLAVANGIRDSAALVRVNVCLNGLGEQVKRALQDAVSDRACFMLKL